MLSQEVVALSDGEVALRGVWAAFREALVEEGEAEDEETQADAERGMPCTR